MVAPYLTRNGFQGQDSFAENEASFSRLGSLPLLSVLLQLCFLHIAESAVLGWRSRSLSASVLWSKMDASVEKSLEAFMKTKSARNKLMYTHYKTSKEHKERYAALPDHLK